MIETILAIFAPFWQYIAGGIALLLGTWLWKRKNAKIERQDEVIKQHEAKEEVHKQDNKLESEADQKIEEIREKVNEADSQESGARIITDELNNYFGGDK